MEKPIRMTTEMLSEMPSGQPMIPTIPTPRAIDITPATVRVDRVAAMTFPVAMFSTTNAIAKLRHMPDRADLTSSFCDTSQAQGYLQTTVTSMLLPSSPASCQFVFKVRRRNAEQHSWQDERGNVLWHVCPPSNHLAEIYLAAVSFRLLCIPTSVKRACSGGQGVPRGPLVLPRV